MFTPALSSGAVHLIVDDTLETLPSRSVTLRAGDLIGRHAACMVSLGHPQEELLEAGIVQRGRRLHLESYAHPLLVGQHRYKKLRLERGQHLAMGPFRIRVDGIDAPTSVLAVAVGEHPPQELVGPYYALVGRPYPDLLPGPVPDADATLVYRGTGWTIALRGAPPEPILPGRTWSVHGTTLRTMTLDTRTEPPYTTSAALRIEIRESENAVTLRRATRHRVTLHGRIAALFRDVANATITTGKHAAPYLRTPETDGVLDDLHEMFRNHGIRPDLIRADGIGGLELFLHQQDHISIEST